MSILYINNFHKSGWRSNFGTYFISFLNSGDRYVYVYCLSIYRIHNKIFLLFLNFITNNINKYIFFFPGSGS